MGFGGWSSWQLIILTICISTAVGCGVVVNMKSKK